MLPTPTTRALLCDSAEHTERAPQEALAVENPPANAGRCKTWLQPLRWEDPLEEGVATHSSILAWRILWMEEPGGLSPKDSKEQDTNEATEHTRVQCDLK